MVLLLISSIKVLLRVHASALRVVYGPTQNVDLNLSLLLWFSRYKFCSHCSLSLQLPGA